MARWCLTAGICLSLGCGGVKEPPYVPISGTVKLDGKPLSQGRIVFLPKDGAAPRSIPIENGQFAGEARAGSNVVQVHAIKEVPNPDPGAPPAEKTVGISLIAERFGHGSQDVREVNADGPNVFDLEVSGK